MRTSISDSPCAHDFDRALQLRDAGRLVEAIDALEGVLDCLKIRDPDNTALYTHTHIQLGYVAKLQGNMAAVEKHSRHAVNRSPLLELASLALYHALDRLGRRKEALEEAVRLLTLRESLGYRELFAGEGFRDDLPPDERKLADRARELLAEHRSHQRQSDGLERGTTVRVLSHAPEDARPGSLATVKKTEDDTSQETRRGSRVVTVMFTDGGRAVVRESELDKDDI